MKLRVLEAGTVRLLGLGATARLAKVDGDWPKAVTEVLMASDEVALRLCTDTMTVTGNPTLTGLGLTVALAVNTVGLWMVPTLLVELKLT